MSKPAAFATPGALAEFFAAHPRLALAFSGGTDSAYLLYAALACGCDVTALYAPLDRIYLTATSAMDFFRALDGISAVRLSGTNADGWYIQEAKQALEAMQP